MSRTVFILRRGSAREVKADCPAGICSAAAFRKALALERARADRGHAAFSLITLRISESRQRKRVETVVSRWLTRPGHELAQSGWLANDRLGVLLPATSAEIAEAVAHSILDDLDKTCGCSGRPVGWRVDSYPGDRFSPPRPWQSSSWDDTISANSHSARHTIAGPASALVGAHAAALANGPAEAPVSDWRHADVATYIQRLSIQPCPWWKRAMDLVGAAAGLVALAPLLVLVASYIKCVSRGPVFFRQRRYGLAGQPFTMWKFRTIKISQSHEDRQRSHVADLMQNDRPLQKRDLSSCVIPGGGVLRRFGIDELPQLFNVLRGEMSLVGPRPDVLPLDCYSVWQRRRFDVAPGITGLWQVSGKNLTTFSTMTRLDIAYVRRRSFWLDVNILLKTIVAVLRN